MRNVFGGAVASAMPCRLARAATNCDGASRVSHGDRVTIVRNERLADPSGRTSSTAHNRPAPCTASTLGWRSRSCTRRSPSSLPWASARSGMRSSSIHATFASTAAMVIGWPAKVLTVSQRKRSMMSLMRRLMTSPPTGSAAETTPLPIAIRSGVTPSECWYANQRPVRPNPVITSSSINRIP